VYGSQFAKVLGVIRHKDAMSKQKGELLVFTHAFPDSSIAIGIGYSESW
jgi:hypothetical protein